MPISYTIDQDAGLVRMLGTGQGSLEECIAVLRAIAADPAFRPHFGLLADLRPLDYIPEPGEARALGAALEALRNHFRGPIAVVVETTVGYGMSRMVGSHAELQGVTLTTFRDPAEAEAWLRRQAASAAEA